MQRKAYENENDPMEKMSHLHGLRSYEATKDFFMGSIRQINHLIQIDATPNLDLEQAKCEIYKISVSFEPKRKFLILS